MHSPTYSFTDLHRTTTREDYFETTESQSDGTDDDEVVPEILLQWRDTTLSSTQHRLQSLAQTASIVTQKVLLLGWIAPTVLKLSLY